MNQNQTAAVSVGALDIISNASPVVLLVLLVLLSFSVITWGILFSKWWALKRVIRTTQDFLDIFWGGKTLESIYSEAKKYRGAPVAQMFLSGYIELQRILEKQKPRDSEVNKGFPESIATNLERALSRASRNQSMQLESSLTFLATTGSTAPFIGLFGTVWGIMNSFQNIGAQGGASLAVVAPGIAEALVATAVGLAAAIPAVMGYNYCLHRVKAVRAEMDNFLGDFLNIVKRNTFT